MAKYAIIDGPTVVKMGEVEGENYTVKLIPEVESEKDFSEIQTYFVAEGQLAEDVLSAAAHNHEAGVKEIIKEPEGGEVTEPEIIDAKPLEEIPESIK